MPAALLFTQHMTSDILTAELFLVEVLRGHRLSRCSKYKSYSNKVLFCRFVQNAWNIPMKKQFFYHFTISLHRNWFNFCLRTDTNYFYRCGKFENCSLRNCGDTREMSKNIAFFQCLQASIQIEVYRV